MVSGTLLAIARSWASRSTLVMWLAIGSRDFSRRVGRKAPPRWPVGSASARGRFVLYCTALGSILGFFMMYLRLRRVRRDLTILTRQIAIRLADRQAAPEIDQNDQPSGGSLGC